MKRNRRAEAKKKARQQARRKEVEALLMAMGQAAVEVLVTHFDFTEAQAVHFLKFVRQRLPDIRPVRPVLSHLDRLETTAQRFGVAGMQVLTGIYGLEQAQADDWLQRMVEAGRQMDKAA